jgi:hypothetical protein
MDPTLTPEIVPAAPVVDVPAAEQPAVDAVAADAPSVEAAAPVATVQPVAATEATVSVKAEHATRVYPSLYDSNGTTVIAVILGVGIVGGVQYVVHRIYASARNPHDALTQFATKMVALIIGVFIADILLAGPDTSLLSDQDHSSIIDFVRQTVLMVFSFFFGRSTVSSDPPAPPAAASE